MNVKVRAPIPCTLVLAAVTAFAVAQAQDASECIHEIGYQSFAGLTLVPVELGDGVPLDFVLDSGANHSAVNDPVLASLLGLEVREAGLARGMGVGAARVSISQPVFIRSGGYEVLQTPLAIHDIGARLAEVAGREIDGLLGWELFDRYVVELDPVQRRLRLHPAETFEYRGEGWVVGLTVEDQRPVVEATVWVREDRAIPVRLLLDTGSSAYLTLITGSRRGLEPGDDLERGRGRVGVIGSSRPIAGSIPRFEFGQMVAEDLDVSWVGAHSVPAASSIPRVNGILGNRLIGRFRVFIDYARERLIVALPSGPSDVMTGKPD